MKTAPNASNATLVESGPLNSSTAVELFGRFARTGATGVLKFRDGRMHKSVTILNGVVQTAASSDRDERFSSILLLEEAIRLHQLSAALEVSLSANRRLGEVLIEQGHLTEGEVQRYLKLQFSRILDDVFSWQEGDFAFETKSIPEAEVGLHVRCDQWIVDTHRRQLFWARVAEFLGGMNTTFVSASGREAELDALGLLPEERQLVDLAQQPATVEELCARSSMGELATARMLWILTHLGFLIRD